MKEFTSGQLLAREVDGVFRQFMHMPNEHAYTVSALWVFHTHLRTADGMFCPHITPRLAFLSKDPGCGKSLAVRLVTTLSHNGERALNPTAPGMSTLLNEALATIGFDEIDLYFGRGHGRSDMRTVLNGGFERGATTIRERRGTTERTNIHGPIVLAGKNANLFLTSEQFDTLRSRSIAVVLKAKPTGTGVERYRPQLHEERLKGVAARLARWGKLHTPAILSIPLDGLMPEEIQNRREDIWTELFRIARHLGDEWPARVELAARAFELGEWGEEQAPASPSEELLAAVREVVGDDKFMPTHEILLLLETLDTPPSIMREWSDGERAKEMGLSRNLLLHGVAPRRVTHEGGQVRGYHRDDLQPTISQPDDLDDLDDQPTSVQESA